MLARLIISALIFIVLTAIKLFSPANAQELRALFSDQMTGQSDLKAQVLALGERLSGSEGLVYAGSSAGDSLPVDRKSPPVDISADFFLEDMVEQNLSASRAYAPGEDSDVTEEQRSKQEAFLQVQASFSDYSVPAEVSYDVPVFVFVPVCPSDAAVSSDFGYRIHPTYGDVRFHYGTDYALLDGDPILAFAEGRVVTAQSFSGYGLTLIIDHGDGITTLYAHCSRLLAEPGDTVSAGQAVALAGHTGRATGPHLHFEVEINGVRYNPELCF